MNKIIKGVFAGSIVTPLTVVIATIFYWFVIPSRNSDYTLTDAITIGLASGFFGIIYTAAILTVYAVPMFLLLRLFNMANSASCIFFALLPAIILFILTIPLSPDIQGLKDAIYITLPIAWLSITSGMMFWKYAKEHRC